MDSFCLVYLDENQLMIDRSKFQLVYSNQAIFCLIEATGYAPPLIHIGYVLAITTLMDFPTQIQPS